METEEIFTQRLILRKLTPEVFHNAFLHFNDALLINFFGLNTPNELEKEKDKYNKGISTWNRSFLYFQLIEKETEKVLGWCGFHTWYTEHRRAEIGYALNKEEYMGNGLMGEALTTIIHFGFNQMHLNRIEAFVAPGNSASLTLLKKHGFEKEGVMREHYMKNGVIEDSVMYALLKKDWEKNQKHCIQFNSKV